MAEVGKKVAQFVEVEGVRLPNFIYGTAWKEDETSRLTRLALDAGFRAIDTANQRIHYFEAGVGQALAEAFDAGVVRREDLFLQTKFTSPQGQDDRLPYDKNASVGQQVVQSMESSLEHLGVEYLDSYVLHGPSARHGMSQTDWQTWEAMELLHQAGKTRILGVSNVTLEQIEALHERVSIKPTFVQNRCFASQGWDRSVREFCSEQGILYQGFSLLTANTPVLSDPLMVMLTKKMGKTPAQVVFRFAQQVGMIPLTGTRSAKHMTEDLGIHDFSLDDDDIASLESLVG